LQPAEELATLTQSPFNSPFNMSLTKKMKTRRVIFIIQITICIVVIPFSRLVEANDFFQFSDTSASILTGWGYELPGNHLSAFTLENANSWIGGDFYGFVDIRKQHDHPLNTNSWYGELSPRFSLVKIAGLKLNNGFVKDLLIATTWERGEDGNESYLLGAGISVNIPGFRFFKANLYARKDKSRDAGFDDMQLTFAWRYPFALGKHHFITNGISDFVFGWGPRERNLHVVPQLLFDAGEKYGQPGSYYLGLEFDMWLNQFGVPNSPYLDTNQLGISMILKVHL
jgi:nucleoside-specific outer membrane channel protein Tsx